MSTADPSNRGEARRARRAPIFGPEPWGERAAQSWSYWDLWFCLVCVSEHHGSLDVLEAQLVETLQGDWGARRCGEAKLSHLADLRSRLDDAGLAPGALASADVLADKAMLARARTKLRATSLEGRALTPAMVETPRVRLTRRARDGRWSAFPVDPARFAPSLRDGVAGEGFVSKYASFAVVERLEQRLGALDRPARSVAERLSLYRCFHTVALELAERTDDSHGNVGEMRRDAWHTYLGLDWRATGMSAAEYWADLCDLVVFEPYALGHGDETAPWRMATSTEEGLIVERLLGVAAECRAHYLDDGADEALAQVAWLAIAGRRFERYVEAAERLGSDHWMPIVQMAESALGAGKRDLAVALFRAADRPGVHQEYLRVRCRELTGADAAMLSEPSPAAHSMTPAEARQ